MLFPPLFLEAKVDIALLDQRVCSGRYLGLVTGPFHGTVGVKLGVILDKLAYNAHWSLCVNRIQAAPGFGPCAQNVVPLEQGWNSSMEMKIRFGCTWVHGQGWAVPWCPVTCHCLCLHSGFPFAAASEQ